MAEWRVERYSQIRRYAGHPKRVGLCAIFIALRLIRFLSGNYDSRPHRCCVATPHPRIHHLIAIIIYARSVAPELKININQSLLLIKISIFVHTQIKSVIFGFLIFSILIFLIMLYNTHSSMIHVCLLFLRWDIFIIDDNFTLFQ